MPDIYSELKEIRGRLENHYNDMQDIEFTIQEGKRGCFKQGLGNEMGQLQ